MEVNFQLSNEEFGDSFAVSVNGETKELDAQENKISFTVPDREAITVRVACVKNSIGQIKHPIGKFFAYLFIVLFSPILFFVNNDNGVKIHGFFLSANPFDFEKTFQIIPTENMILTYLPPKYDSATRAFAAPDITLVGAQVSNEVLDFRYNRKAFKEEFGAYHYPAYIGMVAFLLAVIALLIYGLVKQVSPWDWFGVIGLSFCLFVMLALLIAIVTLFVSTQKLFRQIDRDLSCAFQEKQEI